MRKDKITIAYILITITIVVFAAIYFIKLDFEENNNNIKKGAKQAFNTGKIYSDKMYTMLNGYVEGFSDNESDDTASKVPSKATTEILSRPVLTQRVKVVATKPIPVSKLKVGNTTKNKKRILPLGKLNISTNTKKILTKETL